MVRRAEGDSFKAAPPSARAIPLQAVLLLVGDELLTGRTRDANGQWLAHRLAALGHHVSRMVVVPDAEDAIVEELSRAASRADAVMVTGGLGPTHDDLTTEAVARFLGVGTRVDETGAAELARRYRERYERGLRPSPDVTPASLKQVTIPEGALPLPNPAGMAIGYRALAPGGTPVFVMPGVPAEMQAIFATGVAPLLPPGKPTGLVLEVDLALPETLFSDALRDVARDFPDLAIGSYPHFGEARVTLRFRGEDAARVREAAARMALAFRPHVLSERDATHAPPA